MALRRNKDKEVVDGEEVVEKSLGLFPNAHMSYSFIELEKSKLLGVSH